MKLSQGFRVIGLLLGFAVIAAQAQQPGHQANDPAAAGEVRVPLPAYTQMLEQTRQQPQPAPAAYALGESRVSVQIIEQNERVSAQVDIKVLIETFDNRWTLVPILPVGVALNSAAIDQRTVSLVQKPEGLFWSSRQARVVSMQLSYNVDAQRSARGYVLTLPLPQAAVTLLDILLPGTDLDIAVVPGSELQSTEQDGITQVHTTIPATSSAMISWRTPGSRAYALSRAQYHGELEGDALLWRADYQVEVFDGEVITLPLLADTVTLSDVRIDGETATVLVEEGYFATVLQGRGMRRIEVDFQVPVQQQEGPPGAYLQIPEVPVSRFELVLPGRKELLVEPPANIVTTEYEDRTEATLFLPMSDSLMFSWQDTIPEDMRTEVRANASLYHVLNAEEGVLHGRALIAYEITHGTTRLLELEIPQSAQVNRIDGAGVSDWSISQSDNDGYNLITVFLDRELDQDYVLDIFYEQLFASGAETGEALTAPLLRAANVHRQRGMVALQANPELTLEPVGTESMSGVGENQLPAFVRNVLTQPVSHTYKYIDPASQLVVKALAPQRQQGIFDAQVDTLISIGEVSLRGSAAVEINVKSGSLAALELQLPDELNVLSVAGPSLRNHQVQTTGTGQRIALEFTREMEGQFRIQINYERILVDSDNETVVPTISVGAAEVEHGRIAVEALTAVEVQASAAEQLTLLDINELPQQLVLKTTNPILLAYKYVRTETPSRLALKVTRHQELEVQDAAIEQARYQTLYTRDGLAVTRAGFTVRNSRRQFLRLELPPRSQIWSVFVDGQTEKPARAGAGDDVILIKMINSASGFPVELVYASETDAMGWIGTLDTRLPKPDMVVTHTHWDVFLPVAFRYYRAQGTLDTILSGRYVNPRSAGAIGQSETGAPQTAQPLRITVPTQGIQFSFEKLYANQSTQDAAIRIDFISSDIIRIGWFASLVGVLLLWLAIFGLASGRMARAAVGLCLISAGLLLVLSIAYLQVDATAASVLALLIAVLAGIGYLVKFWRDWRRERFVEDYEYTD